MKKVGLSSCFLYPDQERIVFGHKSLSYMENDMVRFIASKEVLPILIPDLDDKALDNYFNEISGLVLQGGVDLSPLSYNEKHIDEKKWPGDLYRDKYEFKLIEKALKKNIPIFGICRGFQVLNAYFGGTLYQDLNTQTDTQVEHRSAVKYDKVNHPVKLKSNGILKSLFDKDVIQVNSIHHQGVKDLASCFNEEARCMEDLFVEAFTNKQMNKQFILAVQWHPEFNHTLKEKVDSANVLLDLFINEVEK